MLHQNQKLLLTREHKIKFFVNSEKRVFFEGDQSLAMVRIKRAQIVEEDLILRKEEIKLEYFRKFEI